MINRAALILIYKEPAIKWVNDADPYNDDPGITEENIQDDQTIFLIREEDADTPDMVRQWLKLNYQTLFENELENWYTDEALWPKKRTFALFQKWFGYKCYSVIEDTVDSSIVADADADADDTYH
ncbi:MAG: hypothetical protein QM484_15310 [Woeseiaceae bacterium]